MQIEPPQLFQGENLAQVKAFLPVPSSHPGGVGISLPAVAGGASPGAEPSACCSQLRADPIAAGQESQEILKLHPSPWQQLPVLLDGWEGAGRDGGWQSYTEPRLGGDTSVTPLCPHSAALPRALHPEPHLGLPRTLEVDQDTWEKFGDTLEVFGDTLKLLGTIWRYLGDSLEVFGDTLQVFGTLWRCLGHSEVVRDTLRHCSSSPAKQLEQFCSFQGGSK